MGTSRTSRSDVVRASLVVAACLVFALSSTIFRTWPARATLEDCKALLAHFTELVAREAQAPHVAQQVAERRATAESIVRATGLARCTSDVSKADLACAMRATNADDFERCLQ